MGYCAGYVVGLGIPDNCVDRPLYLKLIFGLPLVTALAQILLLSLLFTVESPKYFLNVGEEEKVPFAFVASAETHSSRFTATRSE